MKRRAAALLLALWMALGLSTLSAAAGRSVYFLAVNDTVLPLNDETMPFWENGYLYIPSTIFAGDVYKELEIGYIPNQSKQLLVLYTGRQGSALSSGRVLRAGHQRQLLLSGRRGAKRHRLRAGGPGGGVF